MKVRYYISFAILVLSVTCIGCSLFDLYPLSRTANIILGAVAVLALYLMAASHQRIRRSHH